MLVPRALANGLSLFTQVPRRLILETRLRSGATLYGKIAQYLLLPTDPSDSRPQGVVVLRRYPYPRTVFVAIIACADRARRLLPSTER